MINCIANDNTWPVKITPTVVSTTSPKNYNQDLKYESLNYILYYPDNLNLKKKNPLVIFLHGTDECGKDINKTFKGKYSTFVNNMKSGSFKLDAIYLAPQCSCSYGWTGCFPDLMKLIEQLVKKYNIDSDRISIAGHSLGGGAVYSILAKYPGFFSTGVVLAGTVNGLIKLK